MARSRIGSIKYWRTPSGKLPHVSTFGINPKHHPAHLITQAPDFFRIGGAPEALGEVTRSPHQFASWCNE
jgi:hypothetical protein